MVLLPYKVNNTALTSKEDKFMNAYGIKVRRNTRQVVTDQMVCQVDVTINNGQGLYKFRRGQSYTRQQLNRCALTKGQINHWFNKK
ncbi:hypothetical protein nomo_62 [Escherichia phage nomo]|jgi:hypothetical protein|uniref:Phage protein n=6 Tax=Vequintavirus TaxID=1914852 RepID=A0A6B9XG84_9CAUD|nr:hypothetical protein [Escherichia coli]QBQ78085.1 hypothetical protein HdK5_00027 [Escherichia phage vB_EcoM_HdK5]QHR66759.1 hypothetical protein nomo_62 [Escherichia phage nomo]QHR76266.1 hypothetical protein nomine_98 [Escherichia phage nomine]VVG93952.1 Phage protein [Escherichia phage rV5_ev146]MDI0456526.1 hypothetical protein [Escherichia coli]